MQPTAPSCRFCSEPLRHVMCDLGTSPLANSYVPFDQAALPEKHHPLKVWVCESCLLAQLEEFESPESIFGDYLYFSSYSSSWVEHARQYCQMAKTRFGLSEHSRVVEIASNDGYLLRHFQADGVPVLGIEPAANVAKVARDDLGIPTLVEFFSSKLADSLTQDGTSADLIIGNNVLAHVPDIRDFITGLRTLLKPTGVMTFEFPHLLRLLQFHQFDTIYHEHFSYYSLLAIEKIFSHFGLTIFDVEQLPSHGGSMRIFVRHQDNPDERHLITTRVADLRNEEIAAGLDRMETYEKFGETVRITKRRILQFLLQARESGKSVVAYGAAAKGVTLVNYCGIRPDLIDYVVDKSPHKQHHYMPGVRIPIFPPEQIEQTHPDYVFILPWNLRREIAAEMHQISSWGGKFVTPIPEVEILDPATSDIPNLKSQISHLPVPTLGEEMHALASELYPICRSITGDGVRQTLQRLQQEIPLTLHEVPSGTPVFDWSVPNEWKIREAWIRDPAGNEVVNFRHHNLHVVGYSQPVEATMPLADLKPRLHSIPEQPEAIPYRTHYYSENWGFCLPHQTLESLRDGDYQVKIDSSLDPGHLTYGELFLPGETDEEVLISCHICHPSLANDNLSGIAVATALAKWLSSSPRRLSHRFVFIPGTIGSITWLASHQNAIHRIQHGLVLTCAGDAGRITYKKSRNGNATIDRAVQHVLKTSGAEHCVIDFHPYGYDERQYNSPGINLPVGCLMRSPNGAFPEYHTSNDNLQFIQPRALEDTCSKAQETLDILDGNLTYLNLKPMCEPRLEKYGLYRSHGGQRSQNDFDEVAMLWVLNLADGTHDLLSIAEHSAMKFQRIRHAANMLASAGLLRELPA